MKGYVQKKEEINHKLVLDALFTELPWLKTALEEFKAYIIKVKITPLTYQILQVGSELHRGIYGDTPQLSNHIYLCSKDGKGLGKVGVRLKETGPREWILWGKRMLKPDFFEERIEEGIERVQRKTKETVHFIVSLLPMVRSTCLWTLYITRIPYENAVAEIQNQEKARAKLLVEKELKKV